MDMKQHHAAIRDAIEAAMRDGFEVEIMNDCCGCGTMSLEIGPEHADWDDYSNLTMILGERRRG